VGVGFIVGSPPIGRSQHTLRPASVLTLGCFDVRNLATRQDDTGAVPAYPGVKSRRDADPGEEIDSDSAVLGIRLVPRFDVDITPASKIGVVSGASRWPFGLVSCASFLPG